MALTLSASSINRVTKASEGLRVAGEDFRKAMKLLKNCGTTKRQSEDAVDLAVEQLISIVDKTTTVHVGICA